MLRSGPNVASKGHVKCLGTNRARYRVHIVACDEDVVWPCLGVFWVSGTVCLWFNCPFLMRAGLLGDTETVETGSSLRSLEKQSELGEGAVGYVDVISHVWTKTPCRSHAWLLRIYILLCLLEAHGGNSSQTIVRRRRLTYNRSTLSQGGTNFERNAGKTHYHHSGLLTTPTTPFILDSPPHPWPRRSLLMCSRMLHADHGGPMWVLSRAWQCGEGSPTPQKRETRSEHEIMRRVSNRDRFGTCPPSPTFQFTLPACFPHALPPPSFRLPCRSKVLRHVAAIDLHHSSPCSGWGEIGQPRGMCAD